MADDEPAFRPIRRLDGYLPLEDYGLIGDGRSAALVGADGAIDWLCLPGFDGDPVFCALLGEANGGRFALAPDEVTGARQSYVPDTGVLTTELRGVAGTVRVTDAMAVRKGADLTDDAPAARGELVRSALVVQGRVRLRLQLEPFGGAQVRPLFSGLEITLPQRPETTLHLRANRPLDSLDTVFDLEAGDRLDLVLSWGRSHRHRRFDAAELLAETERAWRRWMEHLDYQGPQEPLVRRSAITLKLCDVWEDGSLVAAPTSSLPAPIGGVRNWDYRYTWIRDASYAVFALRRVGFGDEADAFLGWVLDAFEHTGDPRIMYTVAGRPVPDEREEPQLEGYRRSAPVRWGNGAADQRQHDVYGEVMDCAYVWQRSGGEIPPHLWQGLSALADRAAQAWREPDQGIWEVRSPGRVFTYSAGMCHVALDRAAAIADRLGDTSRSAAWRRDADHLRELILDQSWDESAKTLSEHLDGGGNLDASLLALPQRRVVRFDHPRMAATAAAIAERLSAGGGLLYRYLHTDSPDGIAGDEGAFVLCSFWLVDNLVGQGRLDEAEELYDSLCRRASPVGLLPEQIDPTTGGFCGNFPQAFSHIGVIASGVNIARARAARAVADNRRGKAVSGD
jgi:GH15 family glucan-1,4-alpha-glucosidase